MSAARPPSAGAAGGDADDRAADEQQEPAEDAEHAGDRGEDRDDRDRPAVARSVAAARMRAVADAAAAGGSAGSGADDVVSAGGTPSAAAGGGAGSGGGRLWCLAPAVRRAVVSGSAAAASCRAGGRSGSCIDRIPPLPVALDAPCRRAPSVMRRAIVKVRRYGSVDVDVAVTLYSRSTSTRDGRTRPAPNFDRCRAACPAASAATKGGDRDVPAIRRSGQRPRSFASATARSTTSGSTPPAPRSGAPAVHRQGPAREHAARRGDASGPRERRRRPRPGGVGPDRSRPRPSCRSCRPG